MLGQPVSLRVLIGLVVLVMGVLGMSLALVTGGIHHRLTLDNQRQGLAGMVGLAVNEALERQEEKSRALGLSLQSDPLFERALYEGDYHTIQLLLDDQFHQYFVTAGELRLVQLRLYDAGLAPLAMASEGTRGIARVQASCPGLLEMAARREGPERLRSLSLLCADPLPLHSLLVPVGGLQLRGYLEVVVDPSHGMEGLEQTLGMPLRLRTAQGADLYRSASWPEGNARRNVLDVDYRLRDDRGQDVVWVTMLSDVSELRKSLGETRRNVLLVATLLTLWVAMMLYWLLRRTALEPLAGLVRRLQSYHQENNHPRGIAPRAGAIREFHDLRDLYDTLDHLAHTDSLTLLPNRVQFRESLSHYSSADQRNAAGFALLLMDLNGFKQVNDRYGHQVGDELLHQLAKRMLAAKRAGDILARLGGDEFGMLLPGVTGFEAADAVARKLEQSMEEPFRIAGHSCRVSLSIGIVFYPADATDPEELIGRADAAMYKAKRGGGGHAFAAG